MVWLGRLQLRLADVTVVVHQLHDGSHEGKPVFIRNASAALALYAIDVVLLLLLHVTSG